MDEAKAAVEAARARLRWAQGCPPEDRDSMVASARAALEAAKQALAEGRPVGCRVKSAQGRVDGLAAQLARDKAELARLQAAVAAVEAAIGTGEEALGKAEAELGRLHAEALQAAPGPHSEPELHTMVTDMVRGMNVTTDFIS